MLKATRVAAALTLAICTMLSARSAVPALASAPSGSGDGAPPGLNLDGLGKIVSDAFTNAISGAMDTFWTNFATKVPALVVGSFFTFVARIAEWLYQSLEDLLNSINVITQTPLSLTIVELPAVKNMFHGLQGVAFAALGVVIVLVGFGIMTRIVLGSTYPELLEMLPRLVIALLWVVTTPIWFRLAIEFTNALTNGLLQLTGQSALPGGSDVAGLAAGQTANGLATEQVLALLIFALAGVFLFVQSLIRIAILNLAVVLTPLAMLCWVVPQWTWLYEIWLRILVATFLTQILQTLAIGLGSALLASMLGMVGASSVAAPLLVAAMGVATVMAAWSLPKQVVGAYGPSLALPRLLVGATAAGLAVTKGAAAFGPMGAAAGAAGAAGAAAAAGFSRIVPLPPPPLGAPGGAAGPAAAPEIASFPEIDGFRT
jgi:hypothetical protein